MVENDRISKIVVDSAITVHRALGPGLLESAYQLALFHEISKRGYKVEREKPVHVIYDNQDLGLGYRIDLLVENRIIIELKAVDKINNVHMAQLLTYLKLSNLTLGLILNFNERLMKNGIRRVINSSSKGSAI
jgi:GxxExxY protein